MLHTLKNQDLTVQINDLGAEITSICYKNTEYMWSGDAKYWGKRSPILFPIVGRLPNGQTQILGETYEIERHGFAKHQTFEVLFSSDEKLIMRTSFSEETLTIFPFKFILFAEFSIKDNKFEQKYIVENRDENDMPYGFGLHPGFALNHDITDYYIDFNEDICIKKPLLTDDLMADFNNREDIPTDGSKLYLNSSLFEQDAVIIDNLTANKVSLYSKSQGKLFDYEFSGFDLFALWQAKDAPFICLEPWNSIAGIVQRPTNLVDNPTVKILPSKNFAVYNVTITY